MGGGGEWGEVIAQGYEVSFRGNEKFLKLYGADVAQLCEHTKKH